MIKIAADSTCDLSPAIVKDMDITLTPLSIIAGENEYRDGVDITPADIFEYTDNGIKCRTAAVNVYDYQRIFEEFSPRYESVIQICIGAEFSSCYQNACVAAKEFKNVYVVDSRNLSTGSGHIAYDAALMAREGMDAAAICRELAATAPLVDASFVIDRMDYLHKGGRCSGLEAFGATIFNIKPCIEVYDGRMRVGKKYRGSFSLCLERYVQDRLYQKKDIDYKRIFITHPMCAPETVQMVRDTIGRYADFEEIIETNAGCTISNHCGPSTLGVIFKHKRR